LDFSEDQVIQQDPQFDDIPPIPQGLYEALERRMPERWPNPEMPDRDIWVRAGQLKLLDFIRHVYTIQHEGTSDVLR
jgi:hypothetical protein